MNKSPLLVFNYTPNLTVVGTHHALNGDDRRTLELLVDQSDFVALEDDDVRRKTNNTVNVRYSFTRRGYSPENGCLYVGYLDGYYLRWVSSLNKRRNRTGNKESRRDEKESEFSFCFDLARQRGKDVYLVDMPAYEALHRLTRLSFITKLHHLWSLYKGKDEPIKVDEIMVHQREDEMLSGTETNEVPLPLLKRKGLLVVGMTHAENYRQRRYSIAA